MRLTFNVNDCFGARPKTALGLKEPVKGLTQFSL